MHIAMHTISHIKCLVFSWIDDDGVVVVVAAKITKQGHIMRMEKKWKHALRVDVAFFFYEWKYREL